MLGFEERGELEYFEKNLLEQRREPTTNSTHIGTDAGIWTWATLMGGECSHHCTTLAPLCHPCSKEKKLNWTLPCNLHVQPYSQTKKTLNPELVISGIFIVFSPIIAKIRTHKQATKPLRITWCVHVIIIDVCGKFAKPKWLCRLVHQNNIPEIFLVTTVFWFSQ